MESRLGVEPVLLVVVLYDTDNDIDRGLASRTEAIATALRRGLVRID